MVCGRLVFEKSVMLETCHKGAAPPEVFAGIQVEDTLSTLRARWEGKAHITFAFSLETLSDKAATMEETRRTVMVCGC